MVNEVAVFINTKLYEQAKAPTTSFQNSPSKYTSLNLRDLIDSFDPLSVNLLDQITQTVRCRKYKLRFQDNANTTSSVLTIKDICQFYALCVLLFCTENTCSMPFHLLLTEAVLCHGGSLKLVHLIIRVRAVATLDTCNCLATYTVCCSAVYPYRY